MFRITRFLMILVVLGSVFASTNAVGLDFEVYRRAEAGSRFVSNYSEQQVRDIVKEVLNIDTESGLYSLIDVYIWDGYYVVNLYSATTYEAFCYRIDEVRNGQYAITENYPGDEGVRDVCGTCPSDTVEVLLTACFSSSNHISRKKVRETNQDLVNAGVRGVVILEGQSDATPQAVLDYLSCKNLKLWGRIGHGSRTAINFAGSRGGNISPQQMAALDLTNKFLILNSCYIHNQNFIPSVTGTSKGNAYFYCAGDDVELGMNSSETAFHDIVTIGILQPDTEFGQLTKKESQDHCSSNNQYGFTRNANAPNNQCKWSDISGLSLTLDTPNEYATYVVTSTVDINWTTNSEKKVTIFLLKGGSVKKTIVKDTDNDGVYQWKLAEDLDEGNDYKIRVKADTLVDESDVAFAIKRKPSILCKNDEITFETTAPGPNADRTLKVENKGGGSLAYTAGIKGIGSAIMINEIYIGKTEPADGFELRNNGPDQDMTGWKVKWNDNEQSSSEYSFQSGYVFKAGTVIVLDDKQGSSFYVGLNLLWQESTEFSIALKNNDGKGVDFVKTKGNTDNAPEGTAWEGEGVANGKTYIYRTGNDDSDTKADWGTGQTGTIGNLNPGQSYMKRTDYWLAVSPEEGNVNANSNTELTVAFKSAGLELGVYYDTLIIGHDDPDKESPVKIVCKLTIDANTSILYLGKSIDTYGINYHGSRITYRIPDYSNGNFVSIKLFNLKGELVQTLAESNHNSGSYTVSLNKAHELASGNYICRMTTKGFTKAFNFINNK